MTFFDEAVDDYANKINIETNIMENEEKEIFLQLAKINSSLHYKPFNTINLYDTF